MRTGKIISNGVVLKAHEMATVILLVENGYNVELVPKSNKQGTKSPDLKIDGLYWEMKAPRGEGKWLIKNTIQKASHQAENIIVDLRRIKIYQNKCLVEIERYFRLSKRIKRVKIITKGEK